MNGQWGSFSGEFKFKWLDVGRHMELLEALTYFDSAGLDWSVPKGMQTDGATIPRVFRVFVGPYEGQYRKAAVIHDYYCDVRIRPWPATHRMFYEGMRAAGITESTAKIMYFAVRMGGPRWDDQTMVNSNVPRPLPQISSTEITKAAEPIGRLLEDISEGDQISQLFTIEKTAKIASLSLDEIDARADFEREKPKPPLIVTPERERGSDRHNLISGVSSFEVKGILDSDQMSLKDNDFEM